MTEVSTRITTPRTSERAPVRFGLVVVAAWTWVASSLWLLTLLNSQITARNSPALARGLGARNRGLQSALEVGSYVVSGLVITLVLTALAITVYWLATLQTMTVPPTLGFWTVICAAWSAGAVGLAWYGGSNWTEPVRGERWGLPDGVLASDTPGHLAATLVVWFAITSAITCVLMGVRWALVRYHEHVVLSWPPRIVRDPAAEAASQG